MLIKEIVFIFEEHEKNLMRVGGEVLIVG